MIYITARRFRWPCAIFADIGVFKIRITILKLMQYVAFLWDFSQITSNHQSNTKKNIKNMIFFNMKFIKFHGTLWIPWNFKNIPWNSMEFFGGNLKFHGMSMEKVPWNSMEFWIWTKFHGIPWKLRLCCSSSMELIPWKPQVSFKCCSKSSMELWRKFHGTFWSR